ncbi:HD-GYP domain-containing protein [Eubacteriales bacterium OttesenSCG-928-M02]|nr:HD-GYP domain-containing protein [Eubacteriales bacterium OttesenSCG-928-M02]
MRFVPANCLKPGQMLGINLTVDRNRVLLRRGVPLTMSLILKIQRLGFQGVYIDDDLSKDLMVVNVINDELKHKAKKELRSLFVTVESDNHRKVSTQIDVLQDVVENIVDEILRNRSMMVNVIDIRAYDEYTFSHSINVAVLSVLLGTVLGLRRSQLNDLAMGALVHDIGKVFIDKRIINKASKLTEEEYEKVMLHSQAGFNYIASNQHISDDAKHVVLSHHEKFDGHGYPGGMKAEEIPLYSRIVCAADVYDALVSDRPYRQALLPSDAIEYVMSGYNTMFDPQVVDAFIKKVAPYPVGTCVKLSTGDSAIVVENFETACLRPRVRLIANGENTNEYVDLAHDFNALNVTIDGIVNF